MKTIYGFAIQDGIVQGDYMAYAICECGKFLQEHESSDLDFAKVDIQNPYYKKFYRQHAKGDFLFKWVAHPKRNKKLQAILAKSKEEFVRNLLT